jgi:hypothetical protein
MPTYDYLGNISGKTERERQEQQISPAAKIPSNLTINIKTPKKKEKVDLSSPQDINKLRRKAQFTAYKKAILKQIKGQAQEQVQIGHQGVIRSIGSKAERIEQRLVSINEVPFLKNMESARARVLSPNNQWLRNVEKSVTDSMPD